MRCHVPNYFDTFPVSPESSRHLIIAVFPA